MQKPVRRRRGPAPNARFMPRPAGPRPPGPLRRMHPGTPGQHVPRYGVPSFISPPMTNSLTPVTISIDNSASPSRMVRVGRNNMCNKAMADANKDSGKLINRLQQQSASYEVPPRFRKKTGRASPPQPKQFQTTPIRRPQNQPATMADIEDHISAFSQYLREINQPMQFDTTQVGSGYVSSIKINKNIYGSEDYMEDDCVGNIDMEAEAIPAGRLAVTRRSKYRSTLTCQVTIKAPPDRKLVVVFREMDIEWEPRCDDDYVSLHDGATPLSPIISGAKPRMCGHVIPPGNLVTSGNHLTVVFQSDVFKQDNGFEIVFTAFHTARSCFVDEMKCDSGRCIAASLRCNNYNNCGDNSDECEIESEVLVAIVLSVFLLTVLAVGIILLYKKRKRKHGHRKQQDLKEAIVKASKLGKNTIEIHPCEACSLKIVSAEKQKRLKKHLQASGGYENAAFDDVLSAQMARAYRETLGTRYTDHKYRASI